MSDETFREKVEKIVAWELDRFDGSPTRMRIFTDRILAAHNAELDRIAEGASNIRNPYDKKGQVIGFNQAKVECQAYIQAQKEGM